METPEITTTNQSEVTCKNCAGKLVFAPGTTSMRCESCGTENTITIDMKANLEATKELDYLSHINKAVSQAATQKIVTVKCKACGAETTFNPNIISSECDFCGSPMVAKQGEEHSVIKPSSVLPFKIDQRRSIELFKKWIEGLWWAPSALKKRASQNGKLNGIYIPYWTYDARTFTNYRGERGDDYQETETFKNDKGETETRTVTKTRWTSVSGRVNNVFDDVLVVASKSLPTTHVDRLEPWNLKELTAYDDKFLTGFKTETYQIELKEGFEVAKVKMDTIIDQTIRRDIGGDHQRITQTNTRHENVTFKHVLLPLWISAYKYNAKSYRFMVNGQTGKVQGERPYSAIKIIFAILAVIAVIVILYALFGK